MDTLSYIFRLSIFHREVTYRLTDDALLAIHSSWIGRDISVPFDEIRSVRIYGLPSLKQSKCIGARRCVIYRRHGGAIVLSSTSYARLGWLEDRSAAFTRFVDALIRRTAAGNPSCIFVEGMPIALWSWWVLVLASMALIAPLSVLTILALVLEQKAVPPVMVVMALPLLPVLFHVKGHVLELWHNRPRHFDPRLSRLVIRSGGRS